MGEFTLREGEAASPHDTTVTLKIKDDAKEFLETDRIKHIVTTYSDHIPVAINLVEGEASDRINDASALWTRPRNKIKADQYKEFYHHVAHATDEPWATLHLELKVLSNTPAFYTYRLRALLIFSP